MASDTQLCTPAGAKHNGGVNNVIQGGLPQYLLPQCETSLLIFLTNPVAWVDSIEFISVTMNCSIDVPMEQSPCEFIKSLRYLLPFVPRVCCALTASGCARPRCHVIAICTQDWLTSGRVAMISSMVTSLSSGGGCLMVQGVLGTQAHQSNWKHDNGWVGQWLSVVPQGVQVCVSSTCPLFVAACWTVPVKMATDKRVQSSSLVLRFWGKPGRTRATESTSHSFNCL